MAINDMGEKSRSFSGLQAGIITDSTYGNARISEVTPDRVQTAIDAGEIAIVAGFQGFDPSSGDITTLGRGGSDTTAVALAAGLNADLCEIYSDVDGVYTADPRMIPSARKLAEIDIESMLELAAAGAKILYIRAVEFARRHKVNLRVRSTFSDDPGTIVYSTGENMEESVVAGVAVDKGQSKITVVGVPDVPGTAAEIFTVVAKADVNVDMIVQNIAASKTHLSDISFTLPADDFKKAVKALEDAKAKIGKLSIVGSGMKTHSGVSATLFGALAKAGVNIEMISTSEIRISVVTDIAQVDDAARVVHTAFGLDGDGEAIIYAGTGR
jgi:aspartate kinase